MEFPTYISIQARPGYNTSILSQFGFTGEQSFFFGRDEDVNGTTHISWGYENYTVEGFSHVLETLNSFDILDIYNLSKFNVSEILKPDARLFYYTFSNGEKQRKYLRIPLWDVLVNNRVNYPSDRLVFSISNLTTHKTIRWLNLMMNLNGKYDVQLLLEDSRRNNSNIKNRKEYFF